MKYSKGVETTTFQTLYLKLSLSLGMYRSRGVAWMAKSMQDFCKGKKCCGLPSPSIIILLLVVTILLLVTTIIILYLVLVNLAVLQFCLSLFLEGNDDESHEDVDEEEGEDDEEHDVEDGHLYPEERYWALVHVGCGHRMLQDGRPTLRRLDGEQSQHGRAEETGKVTDDK